MSESDLQTRRAFLQTAYASVAGGALFANAALGFDEDKPTAGRFAPAIGVCTSVRNAEILKASGATYIEEGVRRLLIPDKPESAFAEKLEAARVCGLPILAANGFLPGSLKCVGPDADHEGVLRFAQIAFVRAARAGIKVIVFGSGNSRAIPEGFDRRQAELQFVALLGKMAMLAEPHDVTVTIEPLNRGEVNFINSVEEGAKLVSAAHHPNMKLMADVFHMLREDEPAQHIRDAGDLIRHAHIAEKRKRTPPGVDGDDFTPYLQAFKDIGYTGCISMECGWSDFDAQIPVAVETLREQIDSLN